MNLRPFVLSLLFTVPCWSCGCAGEEEPRESAPQVAEPASEASQGPAEAGQPRPQRVNPFALAANKPIERVTELPNDPVFQELRYPGARVVDFKVVFHVPTAWMATEDDFEQVDAFYAAKFRDSEGELQGRPGRYSRPGRDDRRERVSIRRRASGGCEVVVSR